MDPVAFYPALKTVEIACGFDAVVQGARLIAYCQNARSTNNHFEDVMGNSHEDEDLWQLLMHRMDHAVHFLQWSLDRIPPDASMSRGGLGYGGMQVTEQRLDVTGHALSALVGFVTLNEEIRSMIMSSSTSARRL